MTCIAVIPARGGSKRLPRKNVLPIGGQPMLSYPVRAALSSGLFDRVVVSTEDDEIAAVARDAGAEPMARNRDLAGDTAPVVEVCRSVLETLAEQGAPADTFCCLYATACLITPDILRESFAVFDEDPKPEFVMGVSEYNYPPVQALVSEGGYLKSMWPEFEEMQSQFYPHHVVSNGTFYWARTDAFLRAGTFYGKRLKGYVVPPERVTDINTPEEFEQACRAMERLAEGTGP